MFLEVAFPLPLNRTFHYRGENGSQNSADLIGRRVVAPFGPKALVGYVVGTQEQAPNFPTKPIQSFVDAHPLIDQTALELAEWLSQKYLCSRGEALAAILPPQLRAPKRALEPSAEKQPETTASRSPQIDPIRLSSEQKDVLAKFLAAVEGSKHQSFLLRGITDSGKTELYLRAIDQVIALGRQAIYLLPEIALTPPFIDRLRERYSAEKVGIWHSGISPGERYRTWMAAHRGEMQVILGARSAVFAPFPRLGVIVMDEEHEASYKQEDNPRYHTRDVALWRAARTNAVLIMGSATPSLESYAAAKRGTYTLVELTSRVEMRQLPSVTLIDRRSARAKAEAAGEPVESVPAKRRRSVAKRAGAFAIFSEPLKLAIEQRLARREQVILFVNRRGFTPFMRCSKCGWVARCERCSITLALHLKNPNAAVEGRLEGLGQKMPAPMEGVMQCHSCARTYPVPVECPSCKALRLGYFGIGTQRVEQEVKEIFPFVRIARLDRDVAAVRKAYEKVYRSFAAGKVDVLVGTQMIAKGFDFPGVTLVGVVDADVSLHLPDFRAAERTFQLMAQVAGRTGRGDKKGQVFVQTHHPDHYALQAAQLHDFLKFYAEEMPHRETLNYPPYSHLVNLVIRGTKEAQTQTAADELADELRALESKADILGPALAPYHRVRGQFRYQIVLKGSPETLAPCIERLRSRRLKKAFLTVDIDPVDLI
jgi:primosomal protein N' (replication factor Y) (superfamily II helicase)